MMTSSPEKHLLTLLDWSRERIEAVLDLALAGKRDLKSHGANDALKGRTIAMIFEKPSLRTRVTFEVAMVQTGGAAVVLDPNSISIGKRESVQDVARSLSRWVDGIVARTFGHALVEQLAAHAEVPVINALTDRFHPCQALALGQTLLEHRGSLKGLHVVFVGDGNNVANDIAALCVKLGMRFTLACPEGYEQPADLVKAFHEMAAVSGGSYAMVRDPKAAVQTADCIYTDVWVSMGEEAVAEAKKKSFDGYQVNSELMALAPKTCLVTHCLPAHVGEEITQEVMDASNCVCFDEAENRLHAQKAVLLTLMKR
jgi:ornithine carbamoyltransferase